MNDKALVVKFVLIFGLVLIVFRFFFFGSVPKNYSECLKTNTNDYKRNELGCSYSPRTPAELQICKNKGGMTGPICLITYYNPTFVFPDTLEACLEKIGSTNNKFCDVIISERSTYDTNIAQQLFERCMNRGGLVSGNDCTIRFESSRYQ